MGKTIPLLRQLANRNLPALIIESDELEALNILKALGWVIVGNSASPNSPVVVREVTFAGKATLAVAEQSGA